MMRMVLLLAATALTAPASAQSLPASFDAGRGPQGEICVAERVWDDPAAGSYFDLVFDVRCRGWTETASVGRVALYGSRDGLLEGVRASVGARMACAAPGAVVVGDLGSVDAARCSAEAGYDAFAATMPAGRKLLAFDGLSRFSANLAATARALQAGNPGLAATAGKPLDLDALARPPARVASASASTAQSSSDGIRRDIIEYSVRGQFGEALELANRFKNTQTGSAVDRANFLLEDALSSSNLGYTDAATIRLRDAEALLPSISGVQAELLRRKLLVYRAFNALNQRDYADALRRADVVLQTVQKPADAEKAPLQNIDVLSELNASSTSSALARRDQNATKQTILEAQAHYVRAIALRSLGRPRESLPSLAIASGLLQRIDNSGFEVSGLQWLRSAVSAEQGRVAQANGDKAGARTAYAAALAALERSSSYSGTPLLGLRHVELANAALAAGDEAAARASFDAGFAILRALGPSTAAAVVSGLDAWFGLLASDAAAGGSRAAEAKARFFEASQLVSPPAVASQIAALQKSFESGTSDGAVRARTLQFLDREARALSARLSLLPATAPDRATLEAELATLQARAAGVRAELAGDQQFQQATESVATLAELQKGLRPGEAYLKLVTLSGNSFAMLISPDDAVIYRTGEGSAALAELAQKVRKSIDGIRDSRGALNVGDFDVASAYQLKKALFAGADRALDGVTTLITEPNGPMTQLPYSVLVEDEASVVAFDASSLKNSSDYTKVRFLVKGRRIDTAVSPRSFLISRSVTASRAPQPYIGLGNHARPSQAVLADLPQRGAFRGQCSVRGDAVREAFAALRPVGAPEIAAARRAMGVGADAVEQDAFNDMQIHDPNGLGGKLKNYAVLHFSTHGLKEGELECDSPPALVTSIADNADSDGLLSFEEIAGLSLDANLVVLSACNTAAASSSRRASQTGFRNELGQAATLNGLARAFLAAGSRAVLATHWAIPDTVRTGDGRTIEASTRLISEMFSAGRSGAMGDALRQAQQHMIATIDTSHPYYWGAFMLVGDGAKPMLGSTTGSGR